MERPEPSSIPLSPGVYLYKDARGQVIYVGKARILRRRVLSYFRPEGLPAKTRAMLAHAVSLDYLTTTTEKEALLLEAGLIKRYRPHYNIVLRDDKQYALFRINIRHSFPRLEVVRQARKDGARYFGPFTSALSARETWKLLHRAFALRRCSDKAMRNRVRPCLYHHMGQCPAPCMGLITPEDYHESVKKIIELLEGKSDALTARLHSEMEQAAEALEFETAARLRDQIRAVERTVERQAAVLPGGGDMDALGIFPAERGLALGIIFVRGGAVTDGRAFYWPGLAFEDAPELLWSFLGQYYAQAMPPPRILLPWLPPDGGDEEEAEDSASEPGERLLLEQTLSERRNGAVRIVAPQHAADNQLVDVAQSNAREEARRRESREETPLLERLARALHLPGPPRRIECVDISHTGGRQTRAGVVVFEDARLAAQLRVVCGHDREGCGDVRTDAHGTPARVVDEDPLGRANHEELAAALERIAAQGCGPPEALHPGAEIQAIALECGPEIFDPVLTGYPHAACIAKRVKAPAALRGVRRRRRFHPTEVFAVVDVSQNVDRTRVDGKRKLIDALGHDRTDGAPDRAPLGNWR